MRERETEIETVNAIGNWIFHGHKSTALFSLLVPSLLALGDCTAICQSDCKTNIFSLLSLGDWTTICLFLYLWFWFWLKACLTSFCIVVLVNGYWFLWCVCVLLLCHVWWRNYCLPRVYGPPYSHKMWAPIWDPWVGSKPVWVGRTIHPKEII